MIARVSYSTSVLNYYYFCWFNFGEGPCDFFGPFHRFLHFALLRNTTLLGAFFFFFFGAKFSLPNCQVGNAHCLFFYFCPQCPITHIFLFHTFYKSTLICKLIKSTLPDFMSKVPSLHSQITNFTSQCWYCPIVKSKLPSPQCTLLFFYFCP